MTTALEGLTLDEVRLERQRRAWVTSTKAWAWDNLRFEPDAWQAEVMEAFDDPAAQRIAMSACAGPGKTAIEAICGLKFLDCHYDTDNHPKGACVSITDDNLRDNLWAEFAKWIGRAPRLQQRFVWTGTRIAHREHPETWFLSARSYSKTANVDMLGNTLSGLHGKYILAIGDEAGAIPPAVGRAAEQALSTQPAFGKILIGGNPVSLEGWLYEAAVRLAHLWRVIKITGDPDDPRAWVHSPRVARAAVDGQQTPADWAREQIRAYGRENPWVLTYILGQFPPASLNALIGRDEVEAAMAREIPEDAYRWAQTRIGLDVARYGDDRTVLFPRQGLRALMPAVMRHARDSAVSTDIATRVLAMQAELRAEMTIVDATGGWAAGASDVLRASRRPPINVQMHLAAQATDRYRNRRAELWFAMAEWIRHGGALPNLPELVAELTTPTYTFVNGKFQLEDKDQIKTRLGRSPDLADALSLTFAMPEQAPKKVPQKPHKRGLFSSRGGSGRDAGLGWTH